MSNIATIERDQPIASTGGQPDRLLELALSKGADMATLERLMDLKERHEANEARKAYVAAMAAFKSTPLRVVKSKEVNIPGAARFSHATLADVVDAAVSAMGQHGLSHRWQVSQQDGQITVSCVITHERGHSESTSLTSKPDDSGKKNAIQQIASAITYLERYTLMAALGLAASDMQEDDGRSAGETLITDEQAATLRDILTEAGADMAKFCEYMRVDSIGAIPAAHFNRALSAANAKLKASRNAA